MDEQNENDITPEQVPAEDAAPESAEETQEAMPHAIEPASDAPAASEE